MYTCIGLEKYLNFLLKIKDLQNIVAIFSAILNRLRHTCNHVDNSNYHAGDENQEKLYVKSSFYSSFLSFIQAFIRVRF